MFHGLDHAVGGFGADAQGAARLLDRLVMEGVDGQLAARDQARKQRARFYANRMARLAARRGLTMGDGRPALRRSVLTGQVLPQ